MPTRVEKLEKRKDRVVEKATDKINRQQYGGRTFKKMNKRKRNIDKKIVNTKARVATRAKKKVAKVVKKTAGVLKRADKKTQRVGNKLNKLENKKTKVRKKVLPKMAKARAAGKPIKKLFLAQRADNKLGRIDKKIARTKAR
jgi:tetrahydromethanopterin S-methyltransferase subunit G|tara:strand:+ start:107 stop:532 length:426 start_codon:yes stop_codon:yes gene_type:complete